VSTPDPDDERQILPFATALQHVDNGAAAARASRLLNELVAAVADTGKGGTLTIQVKVAPYKTSTRTLDVTVTSTLKAPQGDEATQSAIFFHDNKGNLTRDDPTQLQLPLRTVKEHTAS
jgi:hypothetical protein